MTVYMRDNADWRERQILQCINVNDLVHRVAAAQARKAARARDEAVAELAALRDGIAARAELGDGNLEVA